MAVSRRKLSENGPTFSRLVHGLWRLADWGISRDQVIELITGCIELGITTFDHADIYGSYACEGLFGEALAKSGIARDNIELITKCGIKLVSPNRPTHTSKHYDTSSDHIVGSVENSLKNLRTEYVDLLLIHRPDPMMDADEVAEAFTQLKRSGKVLHFGVSNFEVGQFELLQSRLDEALVTNQIEYSVMNMDAQAGGVLDMCQRLRISPLAWSPLAGGRLFTEDSRKAQRLRSTLEEIGKELGAATIEQVALAWILKHPCGIVPILGTGKMERVEQAVICEELDLSRAQWFKVWSASTGTDVP
ncbi:MAG: aldo/keto reductase [Phycisphaerales bacterium]|nr:MAG: aldo/keto reductase [Phycisphaerales bacterium]